MDDIIIYGSGGMAREIVELIGDINRIEPRWNIKGYIDDCRGNEGGVVHGYEILGASDILKDTAGTVYVIIAVGDPSAREHMFGKIKDYNIRFPTLIHPSAKVSDSAHIGEGSIIGIDCIVSTDVTIGRHVFLNMRTVVGHDAVIEDFCSCLVNCIIAGEVHIGEASLLGSGSIIMEKRVIGRKAKTSMGSIVCFDVEDNNVVMSRPSKSMYFGK